MGAMAYETRAGEKLSHIAPSLLAWYDVSARALPWRISPKSRARAKRPDPYRVWLSEIMLQQTTVATVTPRFEEFLARWPNIEALADAPVDEVLGAWAGLGYYARARNLHKCARAIARDHGGKFPPTEQELKKLPGIGDYTAAAIAAIAFGAPAVVIDGNVERVVARLFAINTPLPAAKRPTGANLNGGVLLNLLHDGPQIGGASNRCLSVRENSSQKQACERSLQNEHALVDNDSLIDA